MSDENGLLDCKAVALFSLDHAHSDGKLPKLEKSMRRDWGEGGKSTFTISYPESSGTIRGGLLTKYDIGM